MLSKFFEFREAEIEREKSVDSQQRNKLSVTLQKWRGTRRFFTGERGAWSCRWVWHRERGCGSVGGCGYIVIYIFMG